MTDATTAAPAPAPAPAPATPAGNTAVSSPAAAPAGTVMSGNPDDLRIGAPAPAPSPAPAPAPAPAENQEEMGAFGDAGDPAMNLVYRFVEKLGFTPEAPEVQAVIDSGDFSLIRAKMASMGDKAAGWQEYIAIAERNFENKAQQELAHIASCEQAVHSAVGGKEQWLQIQAWAAQNADEDEKREYNALLNKSPVSAKIAARQLAEYYHNAMGNVKEPQSAVSGRATPAPAGEAYALSPKQYVAAVQELARKVGPGRIDQHPDYAKLKQRRAAWRG